MGASRLVRLAGVSQGIERARRLIEDAPRVVVLTGAGISAESGVPTFRGAGGLWKSHRPEDLATPEAFASDPVLVWEWYAWRRGLIAACSPNDGHRALARFALGRDGVTLVTQNVDGLHERAALEVGGTDGTDVVRAMPLELHGAIQRDRCNRCGTVFPGVLDPDLSTRASLPRCASCGGALRPDVVWFGEPLPREVLERAFVAAQEADLCLVVGTSALVHPAASVPLATLASGGTLIEVNPEDTPLSVRADVALRGGSGDVLPRIL